MLPRPLRGVSTTRWRAIAPRVWLSMGRSCVKEAKPLALCLGQLEGAALPEARPAGGRRCNEGHRLACPVPGTQAGARRRAGVRVPWLRAAREMLDPTVRLHAGVAEVPALLERQETILEVRVEHVLIEEPDIG